MRCVASATACSVEAGHRHDLTSRRPDQIRRLSTRNVGHWLSPNALTIDMGRRPKLPFLAKRRPRNGDARRGKVSFSGRTQMPTTGQILMAANTRPRRENLTHADRSVACAVRSGGLVSAGLNASEPGAGSARSPAFDQPMIDDNHIVEVMPSERHRA